MKIFLQKLTHIGPVVFEHILLTFVIDCCITDKREKP